MAISIVLNFSSFQAGGSPVCDRVACPKLNCPGHEHIKAPEDCCPVCGRKCNSSWDDIKYLFTL